MKSKNTKSHKPLIPKKYASGIKKAAIGLAAAGVVAASIYSEHHKKKKEDALYETHKSAHKAFIESKINKGGEKIGLTKAQLADRPTFEKVDYAKLKIEHERRFHEPTKLPTYTPDAHQMAQAAQARFIKDKVANNREQYIKDVAKTREMLKQINHA